MSSLFEFLLVCCVVLAVAFWWHCKTLQQIAYQAVKRRCSEADVQFLDDNVAFSKVRLRRDDEGRIGLACSFRFEFSTLGDTRYRGELLFIGKALQSIEMEPHKL